MRATRSGKLGTAAALIVGVAALATAAVSLAQSVTTAQNPPPDLDRVVVRAAHESLFKAPQEPTGPGIARQVVHGTESTVARWVAAAGTEVPMHHHVNEQQTLVLSGKLEVRTGGETFVLGPGDIVVFPPNTPHGVAYTEDTVNLDFFTPARQDWIDGTATYYAPSDASADPQGNAGQAQ